MSSDADKHWDEVAGELRRLKGLGPLTAEEAEAEFDAAPEVPLSDEQIRSIVDLVTSGALPPSGPGLDADVPAARRGPPPGRAIKTCCCPYCNTEVDVADDTPGDDLTCPTCGSHFTNRNGPPTATYHEGESKRLGRFELLEMVGEGAYGTVWKAWDTELERVVAVKVPRREHLTPEDVERFRREARAAARLAHPHIVSVHEVGSQDGQSYIVSDFVEGASLQDWIQIHEPTHAEAAELVAQLAEALHHAHERGVVHRDVKPGNVLIDRQGQPRVTDFGLAKQDVGDTLLTHEGRVLGTPAYMSPEQARGEGHFADARSDLYSLGVILFRMLTGALPFRGGKQVVVMQILDEPPPRPRRLKREIPRDLETITLKCLEKSPQRRYQTGQELADDLRRFLRGEPIHARPVGAVERSWRYARRRPLNVGAGFLGICVVGLLGVVLSGWLPGSSGGNGSAGGGPAPLPPRQLVTVTLETEPAGAHVAFVAVDETTGEWRRDMVYRADGTKDVTKPIEISLPWGDYLVEAVVPGRGFHQVYRHVPKPGTVVRPALTSEFNWKEIGGKIKLAPIQVPLEADVVKGMVAFQGGSFTMGDARFQAAALPHTRAVSAFYLDETELTVGEARRKLGRLPARLSDRPPGDDDKPLVYVDFWTARQYAEELGKRLPREAEYEFAASNAGSGAAPTRYPWGDAEPAEGWADWPLEEVRTPAYDLTKTGVFGLYSNVLEWTDSVMTWHRGTKEWVQEVRPGQRVPDFGAGRQLRVVRGGPSSAAEGRYDLKEALHGVAKRGSREATAALPGLGFRCCRSAEPQFAQPGNKATAAE
jgi:formylglycine-generating enzyme required for sulfatase activity